MIFCSISVIVLQLLKKKKNKNKQISKLNQPVNPPYSKTHKIPPQNSLKQINKQKRLSSIFPFMSLYHCTQLKRYTYLGIYRKNTVNFYSMFVLCPLPIWGFLMPKECERLNFTSGPLNHLSLDICQCKCHKRNPN